MIALFCDTDTFTGKVQGRTQVAQTDILADHIIIFAGKRSDKIFYRQAGIQFTHFFQFFQAGVFGLDAETVEYRPVYVQSDIPRFTVHSVFLFGRTVR